MIDCDSPISEAQAILNGYVKDSKLLLELRFWVASQGVALNVISNYRASLKAMLKREKANNH